MPQFKEMDRVHTGRIRRSSTSSAKAAGGRSSSSGVEAAGCRSSSSGVEAAACRSSSSGVEAASCRSSSSRAEAASCRSSSSAARAAGCRSSSSAVGSATFQSSSSAVEAASRQSPSSAVEAARSSSRKSSGSASSSRTMGREEWERTSIAKGQSSEPWPSGHGDHRSPASRRERRGDSRGGVLAASGRGISSQGVRVVDDDGPLSGLEGLYIGDLFVTERNIGYGSHGTVVLEGFLEDGHPVAVKRMVIEFYKRARDKILTLITSNDLDHPNVVQCYALEEDLYFMYVGVERCDFNIRQMILGLRPSTQDDHSVTASTSSSPSRSNRGSDFSGELSSSESGIPMVEIVREREGLSKPCVKFVSDGEEEVVPLWDDEGRPTPLLIKLMRDIVAGVAHLHSKGIVHRNIKPHNILLKASGKLQMDAKVSDTGISSHLDSKMRSFTKTHATGLGKTGWQAPEQILHRKRTQAGDMFALGCVLFFCISGGRHPFGDKYERDGNIIDGIPILWPISHLPEALDLIEALLNSDPSLRPTAAEALAHPLFWTAEERLTFLCDASNRMEKESWAKESELLRSLEMTFVLTLDERPWNEKLEAKFLANLVQFRKYDFDSVRDLLHVINHRFHNYREIPQEVKELLGPLPEGYDEYFRLRFPNLLIGVYRVMFDFCRNEKSMRRYFTQANNGFS